jgi:deazaflavin-dependent oxidoreductase (nitroreductase family)
MAKGIWGKLTSSVQAPDSGGWRWEVLKRSTGINVWLYRLTGGRVGGRFDDAPVCILHHRGAKTGESRETPLVHLVDGERVVLVASIGGRPKNPAWYHNVRAHPEIEVEIRGRRRLMTARVADPEERAELWPRLLTIWPAFEDYQARTERTIPVVVCEPRDGAGSGA